MIYRTVQNDVIDLIVWRHYQRTDVLPAVMDANPFLCQYPAKLPSGLYINLPALPKPDNPLITVMS